MDDSPAVRLRVQFPDRKIPTGAEQDHGDGGDCGSGPGSAHSVQLAVDVEVGLGIGGGRRRVERVVVVYCDRSVGLYLEWDLWQSLGWIFVEGVSKSLGFC